MCEPTSIIMAVTAIAGAVQQNRNAKKQQKAVNDASAQRDKEILISNSIKGNARVKAARAARARIKAAGAESGVEGNSIDSLLSNEDFASGMDIAHLGMDTSLARDANHHATQSRLNSIQQADWVGTAASVAGAANSGIQYQKDKKPGG